MAGFVRATIKGWQDTVANPEEAIDSLMKRNDIADRAVELERLQMAIRDNVLTDAVRADGLGGIDPERMGSAIDQIGIAYDYTNKPTTDAVFTAEFLPPAEQRQLGSE